MIDIFEIDSMKFTITSYFRLCSRRSTGGGKYTEFPQQS